MPVLQGDAKRRLKRTENSTRSEERPRPRRFSQRPFRLYTTGRSFPGVAASLRRTGIEDMERLSLVARRLIPNGRTDQTNVPATVQQQPSSPRGRRRTVVLRPRAATDGHNAERIPLTPKASPTPSRAFAVDRRIVNGIVQQEEDVAPTVRETPSRIN